VVNKEMKDGLNQAVLVGRDVQDVELDNALDNRWWIVEWQLIGI
jgi:hypothetical protein